MIPKIIHCCWFGGAKTKLALKCRASWERFASDWEIREFVMPAEVPAFVTDAVRAKRWAVVSDWARMKALYDEGGVYLDYDVELVKPFVPPEGEWVAGEWTVSGGVWMNPGSGIALEKGSRISWHMLESYGCAAFDPTREMMPWINARLGEAFQKARAEAKAEGRNLRWEVLAPEVLSAIDPKGHTHVTEATLGIHHYAMAGASPLRRMTRWLSWHGMRGVVEVLLKLRGN